MTPKHAYERLDELLGLGHYVHFRFMPTRMAEYTVVEFTLTPIDLVSSPSTPGAVPTP